MRARPDARVIAWIDRQQPRSLFTTAVTLAELLVGIEVLPAGQRRDGLKKTLTASVASHFGRRILPFDEHAAASYAAAVAWARSQGKTVAVADGQIAAIAIAHGFGVATRDASPFTAMGVPVTDPWTA